ncbi:hypothetical protein V8B55DRAFT_1446565 [Mucor lusitanicus]|uniref:G-protein coupled receptors family 1 profile domain-containing protein n=2 Tax=Mucor circinelloides f. lusitanicus TaxID=29924 RepID=A0A168MNS8_MUCCL|nr:hypothetical protein FB192DRAFT_1053694 [Mucor lusitanicus]OAD05181.1 hypothetical protein MUCCIDRAFT_161881 [Mucor lusitanicus CBS 277.49]
MYSPDQWEILAEVNSVTCITIVSLIFGRKIASIDGPIHYVRGLLLLLYGLCWAFNLIACMLTSTNNGNFISCVLTNFNCTILYTATKSVLYLYFIEKIHIISVPKSTRFKSPLYLINLGLMLPHIAVILLQIMFRINIVSSEYPFHCTVGFDLPASAVALCYDVLISILYIVIFIKFYCFPNTAQQTAHQSSSLHMMAKRNAIAAITALITSSANFIILICLNGHERGLVASSVSALSLTIICMVIHWVTTHPAELQLNERALQRVNGDKPVRLEIKQHQEVVILTELNNRV